MAIYFVELKWLDLSEKALDDEKVQRCDWTPASDVV